MSDTVTSQTSVAPAPKDRSTRNAMLAFLFAFLGAYVWMLIGNVAGTIYYTARAGSRDAASKALAADEVLQAVLYIGMELVLLAVVWLMLRKFEKRPFAAADLGLARTTGIPGRLAAGLLLAVALSALSWTALAAAGVVALEGPATGEAPWRIGGYMLLMIGFTAFPGVLEELLFRGYILNRLLRRRGPFFALIVSSVLFAAIHLGRYTSAAAFVYLILMGALLGVLYLRTGSLYVSIGLHWGYDLLSKAIGDGAMPSPLVYRALTEGSENVYARTCAGFIALCLAALAIDRQKKKKRQDAPSPVPAANGRP